MGPPLKNTQPYVYQVSSKPSFVERINEQAKSNAQMYPSRRTEPYKKQNSTFGEDPRRKGCQCKIYDYLACGGGLLGHNVTLVKNLWADESEGWYLAGSKGALITQTVPKSPKDLVGASCSAGIIHNLDKAVIDRFGMKDLTHEVVNGASASFGAIVGPGVGVGLNYVVPMLTKNSPAYGAKSVELVIGTVGVNADIGITSKMSRESYD